MSASTTPEVTVMMPAYNAVDFVDAAILSTIAQTHHDWELLAYDDHSTDGTYERLRFWESQDERITVARPFGTHGHYIDICNQLLADAKGVYAARLDADDIALPNRLSTELQFLKQMRAATLVGSMAICIMMSTDGNSLVDTFPWLRDVVRPVASAELPVNEPLKTYNRFVHSSILARRSDMLAVGGYDNLPPLEDWDLELKLAGMGEVYVLPDILVLKRQHPHNMSRGNPTFRASLATLQARHNLPPADFDKRA